MKLCSTYIYTWWRWRRRRRSGKRRMVGDGDGMGNKLRRNGKRRVVGDGDGMRRLICRRWSKEVTVKENAKAKQHNGWESIWNIRQLKLLVAKSLFTSYLQSQSLSSHLVSSLSPSFLAPNVSLPKTCTSLYLYSFCLLITQSSNLVHAGMLATYGLIKILSYPFIFYLFFLEKASNFFLILLT